MRRLGKWILIAFVLVVGAVVLLFILDPAGTVLLAGVILAPLFWNSGPPPIAEGLTAGGEEGDRKLTAVLERHFPGSDPISVGLTGGLLAGTSPLLAALRTRFAAKMPRARLTTEPVDAPLGALKLATAL